MVPEKDAERQERQSVEEPAPEFDLPEVNLTGVPWGPEGEPA
jgi:hypothetical protein